MKFKNIDTPCIGICSTVYGDNVCRGCMRFANEVIEWNTYSSEQKSDTLSRLNQLISQVAEKSLSITDADLLERQCKKFNIRYRQEFNPLSWAYMLLKMRINVIDEPLNFGFKINSQFEHLSLTQLITKIDAEIFALSQQQQA
ncbi:MAG: Fe-S protein [Gammaproteobacteria bacterium]|jgi:predicted Fe-S protein YdhL (DUF1289 family)|nr:Fe-S protein [Gammaproteobacteria bacterium]